MSEYREDLAALRARVEALEGDLATANRALEGARTEATIHERSSETLSREVKRLRHPKGMKIGIWIAGFVVGAIVGAVAVLPSRRQERLRDLADIQRKCNESLAACENARDECRRLR
jgi:hypothetical protein